MTATIISISVGLLLFSLIVLCFGRKASDKDAVQNRLYLLSRDTVKAALSADAEHNLPFTERVLKPAIQKLTNLIATVIPIRKGAGSGADRQKSMLQQAGWTISVEEYMTLQMIAMACCGLLGLVLALISGEGIGKAILWFIGGAFGAYAVLRYVCAATGTRRKAAMEKQLPDMLDLLSVSVAAGLGFERAILHIIETMDGPLIDEFAVTYREMSMGRSRKEALTLLGDRCGVEDLSSVTSALVQAGQLGIPMKNVLQSQSAAIRRARRAKVQEKAAKVSTKILLPMVALIFPVLLIVLLGPSIITIVEQFS